MIGYWRLTKHYCWQWAALNTLERSILTQAFFMLPVVRISRSMSFRRLLEILENISRRSIGLTEDNDQAMETARRVARMVSIAAAHNLFGVSCLDRSLTLWVLLRWRGIDSDLQLGVRTDRGNFEAHAWIEINGAVLNDTEDVRERFASFPMPITAAGFSEHKAR